MQRNSLPHIIVPSSSQSIKGYKGRGFGRLNRPDLPDRKSHVDSLLQRFHDLEQRAKHESQERQAQSLPSKDGIYVRVKSFPDYKLDLKRFELKSKNIRILHFREFEENDKRFQEVIFYIPFSSISGFLSKLEEYKKDLENNEDVEKPSNYSLVELTQEVQIAVLNEFWQDPADVQPEAEKDWVEVWVWTDDLTQNKERTARCSEVRSICEYLNINLKEEELHFSERSVIVAHASQEDLVELLKSSDYIAEYRSAKSTSRFFVELEVADQEELIDNLLERLQIAENAEDVAVTILDNGVNRKHGLLSQSLKEEDRHSINSEWGVHDHNGHGTEIAGLALFQNLREALENGANIELGHVLESSKFLPPRGQNPKELYGNFTKQAVSLASIQAPNRKRIVIMAVTTDDTLDRGRPSSWSAAVDSICIDEEVLFIVSAGNINENDIWKQYPTGNLLCPVEDPAQSWNALTVGAFTELDQLTDPNLRNFRAVAKTGQLSPYSTTGADFESQWPAKPDILFEGGNVLLAPDSECYSGEDDLSILTTSHEINKRLLTTTWATSAATAKMSAFSAILQSEYSDFWSETIRALIIHSAQWTDGMRDQFEDFGIDLSKKSGYQRALKIYGNGVPSLKKARYSADNNLSLIVESEIQPFEKHKGNVRFKELHVYDLPWPKETLLELGEAEVELKVTLSYYIEPMPGNRGYTDKYRYGSHQLEFQLSNPGEDAEAFSLRMGEKLDDNDPRDVRGRISQSDDRWIYGVNARNSGSIHTDKIVQTAAELADCNKIAVYPKTGWWKTRKSQKKYDSKSRYSLIISLNTPNQEVDLYTPVEAQVEIPIDIVT